MEAENQQLKQALTQKTSQNKTLESRLTSTQLDLQDSQEKVGFVTLCMHMPFTASVQPIGHC